MTANGPILEVTQEDIDVFVKNEPFGEELGRKFVRRLELAGRLKIVVSGELNANQQITTKTTGQSTIES